MSPEALLEHAAIVRAANADEMELRRLTQQLERLDAKVREGHSNLVGFRGRIGSEVDKTAGRHRAAAERKMLLDRLGVSLEDGAA